MEGRTIGHWVYGSRLKTKRPFCTSCGKRFRNGDEVVADCVLTGCWDGETFVAEGQPEIVHVDCYQPKEGHHD